MSFIGDIFDDITGRSGEVAAREGTAAQVARGEQGIGELRGAEERAQGFLQPFGAVGERGLENLDFLANPQAQFDFLQQNPLFQFALENANRQTQASAASRGRLGAGDTLQQLSQNVLLSASPLIDRQRQDIQNLLGFGANVAGRQAGIPQQTGTNIANLLTDIGATEAGGIIGRQRSGAAGTENLIDIAGTIGSFFSDSRLKAETEIVGFKNGYDIWSWTWNKAAGKLFGLFGKAKGVMFNDVLEKDPNAVSYQEGYGKVNYGMIGV